MNPTDAQGEPVSRPAFNDALTDLVCALTELVDNASAYLTAHLVDEFADAEVE